MRNDHSAKLRRRAVALENARKQLQAWKSAKGEEISSLLSNRDRRNLGDEPTAENLKLVRKRKIANAEEQISILEGRVR